MGCLVECVKPSRCSIFKSVILTLVIWVVPAAAQDLPLVYGTVWRPSEIGWHVLRSPHFDVIYNSGWEQEAREAAAVLESELPAASALVGSNRLLKMPVVLNGYNDRSNGFVAPFPFRQEIDLPDYRGSRLSTRYPSWMLQVAPHELVHAVQAASGRGFGVGAVVRRFAPDMLRSLNLWMPPGITEGAAVYHESHVVPGAGRLNHSLFQMHFRASAASDTPWRLSQVLERPAYALEANRYYLGGANFFRFVTDSLGTDVFHRAMAFHYRFPFLGFGPEIWYAARMSPARLSRAFRDVTRRDELARQELHKPFTVARALTQATGRRRRRPQWLNDSTLVAYVTGLDVRAGLYRFTIQGGQPTLISHQALPSDDYFWLDRKREIILFARYVPDHFTATRWTADIFRLDLRTNEEKRLTYGERAHAPVEVAGNLQVLRNNGQFNEWAIPGAGTLVSASRTTFVQVAPSPKSDAITVVARVEGVQGIFFAGPHGLAPRVFFHGASVYDVSWSNDGEWLIFSADPGGVSNVFAHEVDTGRTLQLTNARYGAFEGSLSPDLRTLAYVEYASGGYYIMVLPFEPQEAQQVRHDIMLPPESVPNPHQQRAAVDFSTTESIKSYRARRHLAPRMLYPVGRFERVRLRPADTDLGLGLGLGLQGGDPLRRWAYGVEGFHQSGRFWGRGRLETASLIIRPSLEVYDKPSTLTAAVGTSSGVEIRRIGREERGIGLGVRLPVTLETNVHYSNIEVALGAHYEEERFFDKSGRTLVRAEDTRPFRGRFRLTPSAHFAWRLQNNRRDLVPNTGTLLHSSATVDVWEESGAPRRGLIASVFRYTSFSLRSHTSVRFGARFLTQNRGSIYDLTTILPRGHEDAYLDRGSFVGADIEIVQPVRYIDNGWVLVPLYVKAVYTYGFAEALRTLGGGHAFSSAGVGIGVQLRLFYLFDVDLRVGAAYVIEERRLVATWR